MHLRPYQQAAFDDRTTGIEVWLWGRQTGKSFTLAAWAVDRLISRPGRLVTILSNSLSNGAELNAKCAEICRLLNVACEQAGEVRDARCEVRSANDEVRSANDEVGSLSRGSAGAHSSISDFEPRTSHLSADSFLLETRITVAGRVGRIKVLPANPRTARGFSGDLILDEFAFHENGAAIWEAAEPILSANKDFLCRIASTPNGRHNMFYRLATDPGIPVRRVPRSEAWRQGLPIYHSITRAEITPEEARSLAHDKRAYDQNYECLFEAENMALLTLELIAAAEDPSVGRIEEGEWSAETKAFLSSNGHPELHRDSNEEHRGHRELDRSQPGEDLSGFPNLRNSASSADNSPSVPSVAPLRTLCNSPSLSSRNLYVGVDVGRTRDLTVITVLEKGRDLFYVRAMLRLRGMRLPEQQALLEEACRSPRFAGAQIDMTGLGLGLYEYTRKIFGDRIRGLNFASNLPLDARVGSPGNISHFGLRTSHLASAKAPEVLALRLLQIYEAQRLRHPVDALLREDLRQPERVTTAEGRVSIVAGRSAAGGGGHADHFWSLALAVDCAQRQPESYVHVISGIRPRAIPRNRLIV